MENNSQNIAGIDRRHHPSTAPKIFFALGHLGIVIFCAWLVFFGDWTVLGSLFGRTWFLADPTRARILLACAAIYWFRHVITLFYLLRRKVDWDEVGGLLIYMALFEIGLLLLGGGAFRAQAIQLSWLDGTTTRVTQTSGLGEISACWLE